MKKRFLSLVLVIALVFSLSTNCFALSTYTIPDGTVILESVPMENEVLIIPDSVQVISDTEQYNNYGVLQYVSIGENVQYIGRNSFNGANISAVTIPDSVTYIGYNAFPSVETVTFEAGSAVTLFNNNPDEYGGTPVLDLYSAFPNAKTVHIKTTPDRVNLELIIYVGDVRKVIFSDGTVWERDKLNFPIGIKDIPSYSFGGHAESVIIPESVVSIQNYAFANAGIENFVLGSNVEYIGSNIFGESRDYYSCSFSSITIPSSVTHIGYNAFPSVETVTFEAGSAVTLFNNNPDEYGGTPVLDLYSAFPNAKTVHIKTTPDKVDLNLITCGENVRKVIFSDGTVWERDKIYFPIGIKTLRDGFFSGEIDILTIPESVTNIESFAFNGARIGSLVLGSNVEYIGSNIFGYNPNFYLGGITIPASVTSIGSNAFPNVETVTFEAASAVALFGGDEYSGTCLWDAFPNATTVHIRTTPDKVNLDRIISGNVKTVIFSDGSVWKKGELFFYNGQSTVRESQYMGYSDLEKINIPDYIVSVGDNAFEDVSNNGNKIPLTLGKNVSYIGASAFYNSDIGSIVFGTAPVVIEEKAFADTKLITLNLPANVISVGDNAFNTESLQAVTLEASLLTGALSEKRFIDVFGEAVETIIIDGEITEIPAGFFEDCGAKTISYSDKVVVINDNAFKNTQIKEAKIGDDVLKIGNYAYSGTNVTAINVPENVVYIGKSVFSNNAKLKNAIVNSKTTTLPNGIFSGCSALENVKLSNTITTIGEYAFSSCTSLTSIEIPEGVTEIGAYAFAVCRYLKTVKIPEGVTVIKAGTFKNCTSLENVIIPESVTTIEEGAFEGCTNLENIILPENISELQSSAFMNCSSLSNVVVPESVETIGENAFAGCDNLILGGCDNTAISDYAEEYDVAFCCVNATPREGTTFDFANQIVFTEKVFQSTPGNLIKPATDTEIVCNDRYCGTGSVVTITRNGVVQEYTVVVEGDVDGDSVCDVLDAAMVERFSTGSGEDPDKYQLYAVAGENSEEITVNDYSAIVNKALEG